jgi:hypothetical protein
MSLVLTPVGSDNFTRANVNPLISPWALDSHGDPALQVVSDVCAPASTSTSGQLFTTTLPNDQYASVTIASLTNFSEMALGVRITDTGSTIFHLGYVFAFASNGNWSLYSSGSLIANGVGLTINIGDVFTLAVVLPANLDSQGLVF